MADLQTDIKLNPSYIPPTMATPEQVDTITSGDLPSTLSESSSMQTLSPLGDDTSQTQPLGALESLTADAGSAANIPATTADPALPSYDPVTADVTPEATVQGQLGNVLNEGGVLMDVARSAGDEYSNARGMLNSSMGARASTRAMIDTALPIAQQDAQANLSQLQMNQGYQNQAAQFNATNQVQQVRDSVLQSYQLQMENLSTENKASLIALEQRYSAAIQSDKNASDVYVQTMDAIGQLMSAKDLTVEQQNAGMNELVGMLDAYLDFNFSLNSVDALTGEITDELPPEGTVGDTYTADQFRSDQQTLKDQQFEIESMIKLNEYNTKLSELGERPVGSFWGRSSAEQEAWDAAKAALDQEYQKWL